MPQSETALLAERESLIGLALGVSHILTAHAPLAQILHQCTEALVWHLQLALARIWLLDPSEETLVLAASAGLSTNLHGRYSRISVSSSLKIGRIVRDRTPRLTNALQQEAWVAEPDWVKRERLVAYAGYPLIAQDRVVGVLAVFSRHVLGQRTVEELGGIAGGVAQCIRRSQIEEALRSSEERLALAVEGAGMALWDWDLRSDTVIWSRPFFFLLGYEPHRTVPSRQAWEDRIHPDDRSRVLAEVQHCVRERVPLAHDYRIVTADTGEIVWVTGRGTAVYDEAGQCVRLVAAVFNISHRKRAEAEIRRLLEDANRHQHELREKQMQLVQQAKLASIGELATGIAHELNNPLNNIALFVGNALDVLAQHPTTEFSERLSGNLRAANEQVSRAANIINHLRVFGRSGKREFRPVDLNLVVASSINFLQERMRLAEVEIIWALARSRALVQGCQVQLEQVMVNLLANAIDAVKDRATKRITVAVAVDEGRASIVVKDTGMGIAPEHLPRVFDPFFTTKDVGEGTGMGLSIVFGILKEHQGEITVESTVGTGSAFTVLLPLAHAVDK